MPLRAALLGMRTLPCRQLLLRKSGSSVSVTGDLAAEDAALPSGSLFGSLSGSPVSTEAEVTAPAADVGCSTDQVLLLQLAVSKPAVPRALPTPCRSNVLPDRSTAEIPDAVCPEVQDTEHGVAPTRAVSLSQALGAEPLHFTACAESLRHGDWIILRRDTESVPGMLPHLRGLSSRMPGPPAACRRMHLYTDGSFLPGAASNRAGSAFTVLTEYEVGADRHFGLLGFAGGSLRPWQCSSLNVECDGYDAECLGLALACAWCLALPRCLPISIYYDATGAGGAASGRCQPRRPTDGRSAAALARYCAQALEAAGYSVSWEWVKGHSGCIGNEVSDAVSRACASEVFASAPVSSLAWKVFTAPEAPWLWRVFAASASCPDLDRLTRGVYEPADHCDPHAVSLPEAAFPPGRP